MVSVYIFILFCLALPISLLLFALFRRAYIDALPKVADVVISYGWTCGSSLSFYSFIYPSVTSVRALAHACFYHMHECRSVVNTAIVYPWSIGLIVIYWYVNHAIGNVEDCFRYYYFLVGIHNLTFLDLWSGNLLSRNLIFVYLYFTFSIQGSQGLWCLYLWQYHAGILLGK